MAQDLGVVLAMAVIVVAITTWAAPPNPKIASAGSNLAERSELPAPTFEVVLARHRSYGAC